MAKTKTVEEVKKDVKKKKDDFTIEITINEETSVLKTDNVYKALLSFEAPSFIKCDSVVKVTHKDGKTAEKRLKVIEARRAFSNKTNTELLAINLTDLLSL